MVLSMLCLASVAQEERMITDRPGFTNNPATTRDKWLQVETGISRQSEKYSAPYKDQIFDHPSVLIKYGIGHRFELRMITALSTRRDEAVNLTDVYTGIRTFQQRNKRFHYQWSFPGSLYLQLPRSGSRGLPGR